MQDSRDAVASGVTGDDGVGGEPDSNAMAKQGNVINISSSEFAKDFFRTELAKYSAIVKKAGVELQLQ
jgi:hypothetical protein